MTPSKKVGASRIRAASAAKKAMAKSAASEPSRDAIELLIADHEEVKAMFEKFEKIKDGDNTSAKLELAEKICLALTVHTQIEEEIFYPAFQKATKDGDMVDEATVEHQAAKTLIAIIEGMNPDEPLFDARIHVLSEEIEHHVEEEQEKMFPEARKSRKLDLADLGRRLFERKQALFAEIAAEA